VTGDAVWSPAFRDRVEAGRVLAELLAERELAGALTLGLPRGGVPVAYQIAMNLGLELDVLLVRKLGVPGHEELAFGALASDGTRVLNEAIMGRLGLAPSVVEEVTATQRRVLEERERTYRGSRPPPQVADRPVVLVDDGLATGATMRVALEALRPSHPSALVVAVPVGAAATCAELRHHADVVVCARTPEPFGAVGAWYEDFSETGDDEVRDLLARAAGRS
jgi:putative phosphoribosyl transferase